MSARPEESKLCMALLAFEATVEPGTVTRDLDHLRGTHWDFETVKFWDSFWFLSEACGMQLYHLS